MIEIYCFGVIIIKSMKDFFVIMSKHWKLNSFEIIITIIEWPKHKANGNYVPEGCLGFNLEGAE